MKFNETAKFAQVNEYRFHQADQSWVSQVEVRHKNTGKVARVTIRRNAYDAQSYKKIELFDLQQGAWNVVFHLPLTRADDCYDLSYTKQSLGNTDKADFANDTEASLQLLAELLRSAS